MLEKLRNSICGYFSEMIHEWSEFNLQIGDVEHNQNQ